MSDTYILLKDYTHFSAKDIRVIKAGTKFIKDSEFYFEEGYQNIFEPKTFFTQELVEGHSEWFQEQKSKPLPSEQKVHPKNYNSNTFVWTVATERKNHILKMKLYEAIDIQHNDAVGLLIFTSKELAEKYVKQNSPSEQEKDNFWNDDTVVEVVKDLLHENNQGITDIPFYVKNMKEHLQSKNNKEEINWVVFTEDGFGFSTWVAKDWIIGEFGSNWDETVKTFSNKSDADTFILENKPCLSLNDLLSVWIDLYTDVNHKEELRLSPMYKRFETLASTKLQKP